MMLRRYLCLSLVLILMLGISTCAYAYENINISVNGETLEIETKIINNRILIPISEIKRELGIAVKWIGTTKSVILNNKTKTIYFKIGQPSALVNGMEVKLDTPIIVVQSRVFVPLRFIADNLGAETHWDSSKKEISITYKARVQEETTYLMPPWAIDEAIKVGK